MIVDNYFISAILELLYFNWELKKKTLKTYHAYRQYFTSVSTIYTDPQKKRYIVYILNYFIVKMKH